MSVQKIMSISSRKTKQNQLNQTKNSTNSISSERNDTSLEKSEALKNTFLTGISFKGYSKELEVHNGKYQEKWPSTSGYVPAVLSEIKPQDLYYMGTSGGRFAIKGGADYKVRTVEKAVADIYYADKGEEITNKMLEKYFYIVRYDEDKNKGIISENTTSKRKKIQVDEDFDTKYSELTAKFNKADVENSVKSKELKVYTTQLEDVKNKVETALRIKNHDKEGAEKAYRLAFCTYYNTLEEYAARDEDDYEGKMHDEAYLELEHDELSEASANLASINKEIEWLQSLYEKNSQKLKLAQEKLKLVTQIEDARSMKSFFKNLLDKK